MDTLTGVALKMLLAFARKLSATSTLLFSSLVSRRRSDGTVSGGTLAVNLFVV